MEEDQSKQLKNIFSQENSLGNEIESWQAVELNESLHVKYDPASRVAKNHLQAILADVNSHDNEILIEQLEQDFQRLSGSQELKQETKISKVISSDLSDLALNLEGIEISKNIGKEEKKRKHLEEEKKKRERKILSDKENYKGF